MCHFCLTSFTGHNVFIPIVAHIITSFLFMANIILHQNTTLLVDGHFGCFYVLSIMNNTSMSIHMQVFVGICVFISPVYVCRSGPLAHIVILCLTF